VNTISSTAINRDRYSSEEIEETIERSQALSNDIIINNNNFHSSSSSSPQITRRERHGLLHTIDVIERGTRFALDIILASYCYPFIDKLMSLLIRGLEDEGIGGSRGYGNVPVKDPKVEEIIPEAIGKRSESIRKNSRMFTVHLLSPLVSDNTRSSAQSVFGCIPLLQPSNDSDRNRYLLTFGRNQNLSFYSKGYEGNR
jgi:CRISPR/Cas system CSM-associated protein Csm3 (group 7 of RAMP superfamily)